MGFEFVQGERHIPSVLCHHHMSCGEGPAVRISRLKVRTRPV
jgi:hypothetical protein